MGLFDGHRDGVTPTSTADVAKRLRAPVVLVLDASRLAASAGAIALGFATFDPDVHVAGVILNRWNPRRSRDAVEAALAARRRRGARLSARRRHLGAAVASPRPRGRRRARGRGGGRDGLAWRADVEGHVDVARLLEIARRGAATGTTPAGAAGQPGPPPSSRTRAAHRRRLGRGFRLLLRRQPRAAARARGRARVLQPARGRRAARLRRALPRRRLPRTARRRVCRPTSGCAASSSPRSRPACRPTPSAAACSTCASRSSTSRAAPGRSSAPCPAGRPCTSACRAWATARLACRGDSLLGPAGTLVRGHEFHYSSCELEDARHAAYVVDGSPEGYAAGDLFASYIHLHFAGYPALLEHWLERCRAFAQAHPPGGPSS